MQINLFTKQKKTHTLKNELMVTRGESGGGIDWKFGFDMYTQMFIK